MLSVLRVGESVLFQSIIVGWDSVSHVRVGGLVLLQSIIGGWARVSRIEGGVGRY